MSSPQFTIARYKHTMSGDSYIGGFYTDREYGQGYNRVGGFDGRFRLGQASVFSFHRFRLADPAPGSGRPRPRTTPSRSITITKAGNGTSTSATRTSLRSFQVDTGFLTRTGVRRLAAFAMHQIYPRSKFIQKIEPFYWS